MTNGDLIQEVEVQLEELAAATIEGDIGGFIKQLDWLSDFCKNTDFGDINFEVQTIVSGYDKAVELFWRTIAPMGLALIESTIRAYVDEEVTE